MKKVVIISLIAVALITLVVIVLNGNRLILMPGDPFVATLMEYDTVMESILEPLYPDTSIQGGKPDSAAIVQYFLDNDFTAELNECHRQ